MFQDLVSAGIILVLADSQEDLLAKLDTSILETAWMACIQTLLCMAETVHSSAKEYAVALNVIKGRPLAVQTGTIYSFIYAEFIIMVSCFLMLSSAIFIRPTTSAGFAKA